MAGRSKGRSWRDKETRKNQFYLQVSEQGRNMFVALHAVPWLVILLATDSVGTEATTRSSDSAPYLESKPGLLGSYSELQDLNNLASAAYSESEALEMVAYASAVTCPEKDMLQNWTCKVCVNGSFPIPAPPALDNVTVLVSRDKINQGFVGVDKKNARVVVSFRGSVDWRQYIFDLDAVLSKKYTEQGCAGDCKVHKGFFDAFNELRDETIDAVRKRLLPGKRVAFTGHSLGAAMTTHAALAIQAVDPQVDIVGITFGQPRVGNAAFAAWANKQLPRWTRVVNYLDPVAQVVKLPGFYAHMATEVWYYDKPRPGESPLGRYKVCSQSNGEDPSCQNSKCGGFKLCVDGSYHTTYMNFVGITDVDKIC